MRSVFVTVVMIMIVGLRLFNAGSTVLVRWFEVSDSVCQRQSAKQESRKLQSIVRMELHLRQQIAQRNAKENAC